MTDSNPPPPDAGTERAVEAALDAWVPTWRRLPKDENQSWWEQMTNAIAAADRARGRSYITWRRPEEWVPDSSKSTRIVLWPGGLCASVFAGGPIPPEAIAWAEMPAPPAWSEAAPGHADLMVSPESIDAFMEKNPLPDETPDPAPSDAMLRAVISQFAHPNNWSDQIGNLQWVGKRHAMEWAQSLVLQWDPEATWPQAALVAPETHGAAVLAGGEASSIDHQQQNGVAWDIIDEALNAYDAWMQDDNYDAGRCLIKIIQRMKSRQSLYRDDEAGGETDEVMAWNTLIRGAHQWATQHMDQWDKFKFGTRYGPVYVSLVRQTPWPADFVSVSLPGETTPPLATGQAVEGVKKDVPEPASFTSATVDGVPTQIRYGSGPLGKSASRLSDLEFRVVALEDRLSVQEDGCGNMNRELMTQGKRIAGLEKRPAWTKEKDDLLRFVAIVMPRNNWTANELSAFKRAMNAAFPEPKP